MKLLTLLQESLELYFQNTFFILNKYLFLFSLLFLFFTIDEDEISNEVSCTKLQPKFLTCESIQHQACKGKYKLFLTRNKK